MKKRSITVATLTLMIFGQACAAIHYADFSSTSELNLVGSAAQSGDRLRINPAEKQQYGTAWFQTVQSISDGFTTVFDFQYSDIGGNNDSNGNPGTDGISFQLQPTSNLLTYNNSINPGLSIWFDAFDNAVGDGNVSSSRVDVRLDGVRLGETDVESLGIQFRDEEIHTAGIEFDGTDLDIYLDDNFVVTYTQLDLEYMDQSYVGFGGYVGEAYAEQDVISWSFTPVPEPGTMLLLAFGGMSILYKRRR